MPVLVVNAVFAAWLVAQAAVVFGGHDYLQRTTGLTYAEYVHQGFGQLTVATALTLVVIWAAARKASRETSADRLWLRRLARPALRADPGRRRERAAPDAPLPGGVRLHPAPPARRRLRGLARPARARGRRGRRRPARRLARPLRRALRGGGPPRPRRDQPRRVDRPAQPRPVRRHRPHRLDLPADPLRRRRPGARPTCLPTTAAVPSPAARRPTTPSGSGTSDGPGPPSTSPRRPTPRSQPAGCVDTP